MRNWGGAALCSAAFLVPRIMTAAPQRPDSITFTVVAPHTVRRGEPVPVVLRLTNTSARTVNLYLTGRTITFDIIVTRADGQVVWRRLEHVTGQQIVQVKTLTPGETFELKDEWHQRTNAGARVSSGDYTLTGVIPTDRQPLRTVPRPLRIMR
jgi:hypothetical protein